MEVQSPLFPNRLVYTVALLQEALTEKKSIKQFSEFHFANYTCSESEFSITHTHVMFFKSFGNSGSVERSFGKLKKNKNKNYKKYLIGKTRLKSCCCGYQRQEVGKMDIKGFMSDFGNKSWKYYLKAEHN